ncbi:response regulator transcription factor [Corallococcus exiguus]|uniref:helix-turn-helix transcriptional regulator n=1 Tax=Corallococcus TaxID=83461 RepID=UPI000ECF6651|nr:MULTISPECIES: LuxR C-terminal-related transcriptional regulator [Corallococcus]NNB91989.1 response regulator transcription factor [Corallococcus exiguus]NNB94155.1 response regulator transcription factor [Corallococcus exiguus]NNC03411.1 response regulator transcription factor [Corallococcus exiguus]NPC53226.1 response regulator transcription factor [Corallococcus exiguus]RKH72972.1 DNA-binding response regulator [Corallococcus sp. AB032C]
MFSSLKLNAKEQMLWFRATYALGSSLSLSQVLEAFRPLILELAQADAMALCLMHAARSPGYTWVVPGPRIRLLEEYDRLIEHDPFRKPIFDRPNWVVRDTQLLSRKEFVGSLIHQRSLELELRLDHIMAVLLPIRPGFVAALALYRNRPRAFSPRNAAVLTSLIEYLTNAVRNCSDFESFTIGANLLEEFYRGPDTAFLVVQPPHQEVLRSPNAAALLDRWFTPSDLHASGIPVPLQERLNALVRMTPAERRGKDFWVSFDGERCRTVRFVELPAPEGPRKWALKMNELPVSIPLPEEMECKLRPKEVTVANLLLRDLSDKEIAAALGRSVHTVKTHVKRLLDTLDLDSRSDLLYQAARFNKPV